MSKEKEKKTKKVEKKEVKKEVKKEDKKALKKKQKDNKPKVKKEGFFKSIKREFKNVRWPNRKEMVKYSIATIVFVLFFGIFFYLIEVLMYFLNKLV